MHQGDITKLPKWAQSEITRLKRDLAFAKDKLTEGPEDSDTFANPYSDMLRKPLGRGTDVEFVLDAEQRESIKVGIRVTQKGERYLDVYGSGIYLAVVPQSTNTLQIRSRES